MTGAGPVPACLMRRIVATLTPQNVAACGSLMTRRVHRSGVSVAFMVRPRGSGSRCRTSVRAELALHPASKGLALGHHAAPQALVAFLVAEPGSIAHGGPHGHDRAPGVAHLNCVLWPR